MLILRGSWESTRVQHSAWYIASSGSMQAVTLAVGHMGIVDETSPFYRLLSLFSFIELEE